MGYSIGGGNQKESIEFYLAVARSARPADIQHDSTVSLKTNPHLGIARGGVTASSSAMLIAQKLRPRIADWGDCRFGHGCMRCRPTDRGLERHRSGILTGAAAVADTRGKMYLEGDIVVRQGEQTNLRRKRCTTNARCESRRDPPMPSDRGDPATQGHVRVKARNDASGSPADRFVANRCRRHEQPHGCAAVLACKATELSTHASRPITRYDEGRSGQVIRIRNRYVSSGGNSFYLGGASRVLLATVFHAAADNRVLLTGADLQTDESSGTQVFAGMGSGSNC